MNDRNGLTCHITRRHEFAADIDEDVANDVAFDDIAIDDVATTWSMTLQQCGRCPSNHMALTWHPHGADVVATCGADVAA
jgi:hypothetical protein